MWITGWANNNFYSRWLTVTFSEMLETLPELKIEYYVWYGIYVIFCSLVMGLVISYDIKKHPDFHLQTHLTLRLLHSLTILYTLSTLLKLAGLLGVPFYDVSTQGFMHGVSATTAFVCALLACLFLYLRRCILLYLFRDPRRRIRLVLNLIWFLIGVGIITAFAINVQQNNGGGAWEFFLCLFLVSDQLWQIVDFGFNPECCRDHPLLARILQEQPEGEPQPMIHMAAIQYT
jgi:hypothetical protein